MPPTATIVDALDPVIAPNSAQVTTTVMPMPPGKWPTSVWMKLISRADRPPLPMMFAAKMKNGIAMQREAFQPREHPLRQDRQRDRRGSRERDEGRAGQHDEHRQREKQPQREQHEDEQDGQRHSATPRAVSPADP